MFGPFGAVEIPSIIWMNIRERAVLVDAIRVNGPDAVAKLVGITAKALMRAVGGEHVQRSTHMTIAAALPNVARMKKR